MNVNSRRNLEILQLLGEGVAAREVAQRFRLSVWRVDTIRAQAKEEAALRKRGRAARTQIRAANDIDRHWPVETLVAAFELDPRTRNCLERVLRDAAKTEPSLRDLLDLLVADVDETADGRALLPNLWRRGLGTITFASVAIALCRANLGQAFRREWTKRRKQAAKRLVPRGLGDSLRCALCCGGPPRGFD